VKVVVWIKSLLLSSAFTMTACQSIYIPQKTELIGRPFPVVSGTSLTGKTYDLPKDLPSQPCVLLIGYVQDSQFDIDRWILGLAQLKFEGCLYEVPAIQGLIPRLLKGRIDSGMRRGIPKEEWDQVINIYQDAERVAQFFGNNNPRNARVIVLDKQRIIRFYFDQGYSTREIINLMRTFERLIDQDKKGIFP
jgi:hypothetical protein